MAIGETFPASAGITQRKHFDALRSRLETIRSTFEVHWRELGEYFFPRRPRFFTSDKNRGDKRSGKIVRTFPPTRATLVGRAPGWMPVAGRTLIPGKES